MDGESLLPEKDHASTSLEANRGRRSGESHSPTADSDGDSVSVKKLVDKHRQPASRKAKDKPTGRRPSRRAASEALQQLHSESQRLIREAPVNLPYHEPKKMTLYEYLKKRNSRLLENWPTQPGFISTKSDAPASTSSHTDSSAADAKRAHGDGREPLTAISSDNDDLPDMNTAWKQCTTSQVPVDCRPAIPTASTAVPSPSHTREAVGSTTEICYSDVIVSAKSKPIKPRLCTGRDYIRSLVPNLPKLAPILGGKGAGTDLIDLDHPLESFEIFNRLAKHMGKCKRGVSKTAATPSIVRRDENGLALFQWRSSEAGLDDKDLPPGAQRAALRQALLDRLQLRRRLELQKRREAYKQDNEQRFEKDIEGCVDEHEDEEEFTEASDTEEEEEGVEEPAEESEADGCSPGDESDDEQPAAVRGNPFIDDEAEDSDRAEDHSSVDGDGSGSLNLRLDSDEADDDDVPLPRSSEQRRRKRKAYIIDDDDDDSIQLTSLATKLENSSCPSLDVHDHTDACKLAVSGDASGDTADTLSINRRQAGRCFALPVEDSQLLLGQQVNGHSQAETAEPTRDFGMSLMEATQASHSESFLLDDEGFLRYKSPQKTSTATIKSSRRRLELVYIPESTEAVHSREDGVMSERSLLTKHIPNSVDGLMTAFATNDRLAASDEAIALCSGGFSGIDRSALTSGLQASNDKCTIADEAARLCSGGFVHKTDSACSPTTLIDNGPGAVGSSGDRRATVSSGDHHRISRRFMGNKSCVPPSAKAAASPEGTARKPKRVRLWATGDTKRHGGDDSCASVEAVGQKSSGDTHSPSGEKGKFLGFLSSRKRKIRRDFVEEEAELSGSEEASDDEEVALDDNAKELLQEMADADHDDVGTEEELRNQVGRVHMKSLMDADHKDVLLMQERFLPDGDLHSDSKRLRRFRWTKRDPTVFAGSVDDQDDSADEKEMESEYAWRKERFEREQWLKNHAPPEDIFDFLPLRPTSDPNIDRIWKSLVAKAKADRQAKADRLAKAQTEAPTRTTGQDDDPPTPSKMYNMNMKMACRGSFLAKSKEELARLAKIYGGKTINPYGAKRNGKFVFTMMSPPSAKGSKKTPKKETQSSGHQTSASSAYAHTIYKPRSLQPGENKEPEYPKDSILAYL